MRKLATIRKVNEIIPIEGADKIEIARIDGWQCVVKKGEFDRGEIGVYIEVDALVPCTPAFAFLESRGRKRNADGTEGYRIKSTKIKGQLSQGLLLPMDLFPELYIHSDALPVTTTYNEYVLGTDVTDLLGISLYEPPMPAQINGDTKGPRPGWLPMYDIERIQNLPEYFEIHKNTEFEVTEKLDGTNFYAYYYNGEFGCGSRSQEKHPDGNNIYSKIAQWLNLKTVLANIGRNIALRGEIIGEGIQKNIYKIKGNDFYLFDIYDIDAGRYMPTGERKVFYNEYLAKKNIKHVPTVFDHVDVFNNDRSMDQLLQFADGKSKLNSNTDREGLVFKSIDGRVTFKAISNKYLLGE